MSPNVAICSGGMFISLDRVATTPPFIRLRVGYVEVLGLRARRTRHFTQGRLRKLFAGGN